IIQKRLGKKLIGFPTFNGYELYTYDEAEAEFTKLASLGSPESENFYYYYYYDARGLFIDDYFYVYINNHLVSYSLDTLDVCEWVNLG
ncbi:MAG TPA: beta-propeller domain-containing protein, partial [Eubacteriales bacterium]|nr:beta-propeller domain-containing protein [Eubacteriales bacterium]